MILSIVSYKRKTIIFYEKYFKNLEKIIILIMFFCNWTNKFFLRNFFFFYLFYDFSILQIDVTILIDNNLEVY